MRLGQSELPGDFDILRTVALAKDLLPQKYYIVQARPSVSLA